MNTMMQQVWYRGPSRKTLHEAYAKNGQIDEQAPIQSMSNLIIQAPVDDVWQLIVHVSAWPTITSAIRDVQLESTVTVDAYFMFRLFNFPIRTHIAVVTPQRELTWTGRSLWFNAIDRLRVEPTPNGDTCLSIAESFTGVLAVPLMSRTRLQAQHEQLLRAFKQAAEHSSA